MELQNRYQYYFRQPGGVRLYVDENAPEFHIFPSQRHQYYYPGEPGCPCMELLYRETARHDWNDSPDRFKLSIKDGADVNARNNDGQTAFHQVNNEEIYKILLENGADINAIDNNGNTPLMTAIRDVNDERENLDIIHFLLLHNADVRIQNNKEENALCYYMDDLINVGRFDLVEILFLFTYDDIKEPIPWKVIKKLGHTPELLHIFRQIVEVCSEIEYQQDQHCSIFLTELFGFDLKNLLLFLDKFKDSVVDCLKYLTNCYEPHYGVIYIMGNGYMKWEQFLLILIEFDLLEDFIEQFDEQMSLSFGNIIRDINDINEITLLILTLLSYGFSLPLYTTLEQIYNRFGYCELFRILLHCDLTEEVFCSSSLTARLIYDIRFSLDTWLEVSWHENLLRGFIQQLLEHFAHPKLFEYCLKESSKCEEVIVSKVHRMPKIPKLLELSRNAARQHIISRFGMKNSRQLYTYIDYLEIDQVYKDILSYRKKIYHDQNYL